MIMESDSDMDSDDDSNWSTAATLDYLEGLPTDLQLDRLTAPTTHTLLIQAAASLSEAARHLAVAAQLCVQHKAETLPTVPVCTVALSERLPAAGGPRHARQSSVSTSSHSTSWWPQWGKGKKGKGPKGFQRAKRWCKRRC